MPYYNYDSVVTRWINRVTGKTTKPNLDNERMPIRADVIYSFGSHFEMARPIRDRQGKTFMFLVNGDTFSNTTTRHQSRVRAGIQTTGLPSVIIPHRALDAAGIDLNSVRILDRSEDTFEVTEHLHYELPLNAVLEWAPFSDYVDLTPEELQACVDRINADRRAEWQHNQDLVRTEIAGDGSKHFWTRRYYLVKAPRPLTVERWLDGLSKWDRADRTRAYRVVGHQLKCWTDRRRHHEWEIRYLPDGRTLYRRETRRHRLGESLVQGSMDYTVRLRCKDCRGLGRQIGPKRLVQRTDRNWRNLGEYTTVDVELDTPECGRCWGRGTVTRTRRRTAKFLSGFDSNETVPSYFFCELPPKSPATTIAEAYEALKPDSVRLAEQMGREVKRQGDIFAVPLAAMTRRQLTQAGARFEKGGNLLNTNHEATEVAHLPDGTTLARGCLKHAPFGRQPDHRRITLGRQWHVVQKNLVPIAA